MEGFNKKRVKEVSDKIQALLDELSKTEGIQMTMAGGKFDSDSFTLKISGKLLAEDGSRFISKASNVDADWAAKREDIAYSTPHFIGSVWRFRSSGLVRVEEYQSKNRKYPFICSVYDEDKRIKATAGSFKSGTEVPMPTTETFFTWFVTDVEDDRITQLEEEACDNVNDFVSCRFDGYDGIDTFFDLCGDYYEKYVEGKKKISESVRTLSNKIYGHLIIDNNITEAVNLLKAFL